MNPPEDVPKEGLAEIFGVGPPVRWERPLLFLATWFLSAVAVQPFVLMRATDGEAWQWSIFSPSPWSVVVTLSTSLVLTAVAFVVLMFIRQVFLAVPVLTLVSALVSRPINVFFYKLQFAQFDSEFAATLPWFDLGLVGRFALWHFLVFVGLALGLRFLKSRWLGLLVGATGGALVAELTSDAMMAFVDSDASGVDFFLIVRAVAQAIIFALLLIAALAVAGPLKEEPRVPRGFYVGTTGAAEHFDLEASALGLFFRGLAVSIALVFVIPAPWIVCWFFGWIMSQVRLSGRPTLSFRGTPGSVAMLAMLYGLALVLSFVSGTDDDLAWLGWVATLVSIPLGWAYLRWIINHTQVGGRSLRFD